eukprot:TRINITY_DN12773_c0_g1_i2.p2 TRINITY_DN12773_c0_g1~~TRINITY_DN12773_c0_g1_i2.p2  ORF type:complete len:147 (+),score=42.66 TRINITY_DN12773_c0_g1_i2:120-560(+)
MKHLASLAKSIKVFTTEEITHQFHSTPLFNNSNNLAFYNGAINAIVTDKAFMNIWIDDKLIHKGFGVFDTLNIVNYSAYLLDKHLARFEQSAKYVGLVLPHSLKEIEKILLSLAAYTKKPNMAIRYWCSRGPGSLDIATGVLLSLT